LIARGGFSRRHGRSVLHRHGRVPRHRRRHHDRRRHLRARIGHSAAGAALKARRPHREGPHPARTPPPPPQPQERLLERVLTPVLRRPAARCPLRSSSRPTTPAPRPSGADSRASGTRRWPPASSTTPSPLARDGRGDVSWVWQSAEASTGLGEVATVDQSCGDELQPRKPHARPSP